jgi:hypothetical protein
VDIAAWTLLAMITIMLLISTRELIGYTVSKVDTTVWVPCTVDTLIFMELRANFQLVPKVMVLMV